MENKDYKVDIITQKLLFLDKALENLKVALDEPVRASRAQIDSSIQRFKYTFELCCKTIHITFATQEEPLYYPKDILKYAYKTHIIQNDQLWLSMLADKNESSHIYNVEVADRIYVSIKTDYFPELEKTVMYLKNTFSIKE